MLFRFPLFASLAFRVLSLCAVVKVRSAIPEDDIVFQDIQDSQYLFCAGLAPAGELHPQVLVRFLSCSLAFRFQALAFPFAQLPLSLPSRSRLRVDLGL